MATIYDSYQLENSRAVRPFVGSTLNELRDVSDVMQQRYDASVLGMDAIGEFIKQAKALPQDQALLNERLKHYQGQLDDWSKRADLENVPLDVQKSARHLTNEYKNFADNYARAMADDKRIEEMVAKGEGAGGVSRRTGDLLKARAMSNYRGMQYDPTTGRYSGTYQDASVAPEVNVNDWIKKVVGDVAASRNARSVERADGWYFVTNSGAERKVDWENDIKPRIREAYSLDGQIQGDFNQRANLAAWQNRGGSLADIADTPENKNVRAEITDLVNKGYSESEAIQEVTRQSTLAGLRSTLENFGKKYAFTDTESGFAIGAKTMEGEEESERRKQLNPFIEIGYAIPGGTNTFQSAAEVDSRVAELTGNATTAMKNLSDFVQGKQLVGDRVLGRNKDGQLVDMTKDYQDLQKAVTDANTAKFNLEKVQKEAAKKTGFDPNNVKPFQAGGDAEYQSMKEYYTRNGVIERIPTGDGKFTNQKMRDYTPEEVEQLAQQARATYINDKMKGTPAYKAYEQELKDRLKSVAEVGGVYTIQNPGLKNSLTESVTAMASGLGADEAALMFTDEYDNQITAGDYDNLQGKMEVVGFKKDKQGNTTLKVRAWTEKDGKKTKGKNYILNAPNIEVDEYLKKNMPPEQYNKFNLEGQINAATNNDTKQGQVRIPFTNLMADVQSENGRWRVTIPPIGGSVVPLAPSYESKSAVAKALMTAGLIAVQPRAKKK